MIIPLISITGLKGLGPRGVAGTVFSGAFSEEDFIITHHKR